MAENPPAFAILNSHRNLFASQKDQIAQPLVEGPWTPKDRFVLCLLQFPYRTEHEQGIGSAMSYDGRAIANFVLDRCEKRGIAITHLALQKIVYFCHVWSLIEFKRPLIKHKFEAWEHGPVLPYLYREFKQFDRAPINSRAKQIDARDGSSRVVSSQFDQPTTEFLEGVIDFYGRMRAGDLRELSHVAGGPWDEVWNHGGAINPGMKIDDARIAEFYSKISRPFLAQ